MTIGTEPEIIMTEIRQPINHILHKVMITPFIFVVIASSQSSHEMCRTNTFMAPAKIATATISSL